MRPRPLLRRGRVMNGLVDPDWCEWDLIVLGGAAAGENAPQYATQFSGLDAVIVEKDLVGGECSYWACMPSKAPAAPGRDAQLRARPAGRETADRRP